MGQENQSGLMTHGGAHGLWIGEILVGAERAREKPPPVLAQDTGNLGRRETGGSEALGQARKIRIVPEPAWLLWKGRRLRGLRARPAAFPHPLHRRVGLILTEIGSDPQMLGAD